MKGRLAVVCRPAAASGFALVGAAAFAGADGSRRVAVTGVGAAPFLLDGGLDDAELFGDRFAPVEYRRQLTRTLIDRATALAEQRAKEDETWTP